MTKSFVELLWESFRDVHGVPGFIFSIILTFISWSLLPNTKIAFYWVVIIGTVCFLLVFTLGNAAYKALHTTSLPKIISVMASSTNPNNKLYLLEASDLFSHGTLVSFYYLEGNYEEFIGSGKVVIIQDNKLIQVELTHPIRESSKIKQIVEHISEGNFDLKKLKVKPSIPNAYFYQITQNSGEEK